MITNVAPPASCQLSMPHADGAADGRLRGAASARRTARPPDLLPAGRDPRRPRRPARRDGAVRRTMRVPQRHDNDADNGGTRVPLRTPDLEQPVKVVDDEGRATRTGEAGGSSQMSTCVIT